MTTALNIGGAPLPLEQTFAAGQAAQTWALNLGLLVEDATFAAAPEIIAFIKDLMDLFSGKPATA